MPDPGQYDPTGQLEMVPPKHSEPAGHVFDAEILPSGQKDREEHTPLGAES
jgi:hypothetical protein